MIGHLAASARRYRRAWGRCRRTGEGAADVLTTLGALAAAAQACADATDIELTHRHFARRAVRYELLAAHLRERQAASSGGFYEA